MSKQLEYIRQRWVQPHTLPDQDLEIMTGGNSEYMRGVAACGSFLDWEGSYIHHDGQREMTQPVYTLKLWVVLPTYMQKLYTVSVFWAISMSENQ